MLNLMKLSNWASAATDPGVQLARHKAMDVITAWNRQGDRNRFLALVNLPIGEIPPLLGPVPKLAINNCGLAGTVTVPAGVEVANLDHNKITDIVVHSGLTSLSACHNPVDRMPASASTTPDAFDHLKFLFLEGTPVEKELFGELSAWASRAPSPTVEQTRQQGQEIIKAWWKEGDRNKVLSLMNLPIGEMPPLPGFVKRLAVIHCAIAGPVILPPGIKIANLENNRITNITVHPGMTALRAANNRMDRMPRGTTPDALNHLKTLSLFGNPIILPRNMALPPSLELFEISKESLIVFAWPRAGEENAVTIKATEKTAPRELVAYTEVLHEQPNQAAFESYKDFIAGIAEQRHHAP